MFGTFFLSKNINYILCTSVFLLLMSCGAIPTENPCDPSSGDFLKTQLIKLLLNDTTSNCSVSACGELKKGEAAKIVLGQPDFTSSTLGSGTNQFSPSGSALDLQGGLWVSDGNIGRAMHFASPFSNYQNADIILSGLNVPRGIAVAPDGGLWVTSSLGDSVLHYPSGMNSSTPSDMMLGTGSGAITQNTVDNPFGVSVDSAGAVWIADYFNSRALRFSPPLTSNMNADLVLGHPNFSAGGGGLSASFLSGPFAVATDPTGHVWVADTGNNRILRFSPPFSNGMAADLVLGQPDFLTSTGATNAQTLYNPNGISFAQNGAVWVSDNSNMRAVRFSPPFSNGKAADNVIGKPDFVTNSGTLSASVVGSVSSVNVAPCGLWVADSQNSRMLFFP